jgi:hypothetical protein
MPRPRTAPKQESVKAKAACDEYLAMGYERSLTKLCAVLGKPPGFLRTLQEWSRTFGWVERAKEYDKEQLNRKQIEHQKAIDEMNKRHIRLAMEQQANAMGVIERLKSVKGRGGMGAIAAVNLLKLAVDLERVANDAATEQVALTGNKNADPLDVTIVETFWGRGTDPRRKESDETHSEDKGFDIEVPDLSDDNSL